MAYKLKPNKSMLSRFKVTKTGKVKHHRAKTSHLQSARSSKTKRHLGRPSVLFEGNARNLRRLMGAGHLNPIRTAHLRALAAKQKEAQPAAAEAK
jgi:large subunit ribosomal protein L35